MADREFPGLSNRTLSAVANGDYLDELYEIWKLDPDRVGSDWNLFFQGFELAMCPQSCTAGEQADAQSRLNSLIYAFRNQGYLIADLDPLGQSPRSHPDLTIERFGFGEEDLQRVFDTGHFHGPKRDTLQSIVTRLEEIYCRRIGVEYLHIQDLEIRLPIFMLTSG